MGFNTIISNARAAELRKLMGMGLTLQDAEDVFQDASVALYDAMSGKRLAMMSTPEAYLHGICQNMGYRKLEEMKRRATMVDDDKLDRLLALTEESGSAYSEVATADDDEVDYQATLGTLLNRLSARDYALIVGFYIEGKSFDQLAAEQNMASVEVARTTKCRIMNRLRAQAVSCAINQ